MLLLLMRIHLYSFKWHLFSSLCRWLTAKSDKSGQDMEHLDFKIVVEPKDSQSFTVILVASSRQEKSAWTSDISQARRPALPSSARESDDATELTNIPSVFFVYRCPIWPTVHRQHPLQWADDERF